MRVVIIVLVVIVVAFGIVLTTGGQGGDGTGENKAPKQNTDGSIDEDALEDWTPPPLSKLIADFTAPFAPGVELENPTIALAPSASASRVVPPSSSDVRVARIELKSGGGLRIEYSCLPTGDRQCPQTVCLCSPRTPFTLQQIQLCPSSWRRKLEGNSCSADEDKATTKASLVVYPEPGTLTFLSLGPPDVTAEVK